MKTLIFLVVLLFSSVAWALPGDVIKSPAYLLDVPDCNYCGCLGITCPDMQLPYVQPLNRCPQCPKCVECKYEGYLSKLSIALKGANCEAVFGPDTEAVMKCIVRELNK
jgi:hypothetical protein